jgi:hypothetical protein
MKERWEFDKELIFCKSDYKANIAAFIISPNKLTSTQTDR